MIAQTNSQRLLSLVNDILDMERIEGDRMAFDFQQVEIKPLIEGAIEATRVFAETLDVAVRLAAQCGGTIFRIDLPRGGAKAVAGESERSLTSIQ